MKIKVGKLIDKLKKIEEKYGSNTEVVIDYDDNGWYDLEKVQIIHHHDESGNDYSGRTDVYINLQSSNES